MGIFLLRATLFVAVCLLSAGVMPSNASADDCFDFCLEMNGGGDYHYGNPNWPTSYKCCKAVGGILHDEPCIAGDPAGSQTCSKFVYHIQPGVPHFAVCFFTEYPRFKCESHTYNVAIWCGVCLDGCIYGPCYPPLTDDFLTEICVDC